LVLAPRWPTGFHCAWPPRCAGGRPVLPRCRTSAALCPWERFRGRDTWPSGRHLHLNHGAQRRHNPLMRPFAETPGLEPARVAVVPDPGSAKHRENLPGGVVADALAVELSPADVARVVGVVPQAVELSQVVEVDPVVARLRPAAAASLDEPGLQPRPTQCQRHPCAVVARHRRRQFVCTNHDLPHPCRLLGSVFAYIVLWYYGI